MQRYVKKEDIQTALERVFARVCEYPQDRHYQYVNVMHVTDEAEVVAKERGIRNPLFHTVLRRGGELVEPVKYVHSKVLRCKLPGWRIHAEMSESQVRVAPEHIKEPRLVFEESPSK